MFFFATLMGRRIGLAGVSWAWSGIQQKMTAKENVFDSELWSTHSTLGLPLKSSTT
jgi:hypothetical protein